MLILGIDSQFAYIEAVATVLTDLGIGDRLPRCVLSGSALMVGWRLLEVTGVDVQLDGNRATAVSFRERGLMCMGRSMEIKLVLSLVGLHPSRNPTADLM